MNEETSTTPTEKAKRKPSSRASVTRRAKKTDSTLRKSYCTNCGHELSKDVKFCPACGAKVAQTRKAKAEPLSDTQPEQSAMPAEVPEQSKLAAAVPERPETPVVVPEQPETPAEVKDPSEKKKARKKEQVDYEALLMANMPEDVRRRKPFATFALIGVSVLFAIIMLCATGSFNPDPQDFIDYGANFRRLTFRGQLWRLVTSSFLHFGLQHLVFNMLCLFALGRFLEKMIGHANLLCVYLLTACTGGILSLCFHDNEVCAGASGAVFGVFGASIALVALLWRKYSIDPKHMWGYMKNGLAFVGINFIYSLFPGVDMAGHIGGLLGGLAVGGALTVPLLVEGKPFGKWFQRGFWGGSALLAVVLTCTVAVGGGSSGGGGGSSSRSGDEDDDEGLDWRKIPTHDIAAPRREAPSLFGGIDRENGGKKSPSSRGDHEDRSDTAQLSPTAVLEDEQRKVDTVRDMQNFMNDLTATLQKDMAGSIDSAVRKIRSDAERGNTKAQCKLAWCYLNGHGVKRDLDEAIRWYRKAAELGDAEGQANVGDAYANGIGVEKNSAEAVRWYRKAAEQGYAGAQKTMGVRYLFGEGVAKDEETAVLWLKKAAAQGHAEAQYFLGMCFDNGWGVAKDIAEAARLYRNAAVQGHAGAQCDLGFCYLNGNGVRKDEDEAFRLFSKSAAQGHSLAQNNIGACYANGWAVARNEAEAVKWYRKAAEQGLAHAQKNLGLCYLNGQGVIEDVDEARRWLRKAAEQGDEEAANLLRKLEMK